MIGRGDFLIVRASRFRHEPYQVKLKLAAGLVGKLGSKLGRLDGNGRWRATEHGADGRSSSTAFADRESAGSWFDQGNGASEPTL